MAGLTALATTTVKAVVAAAPAIGAGVGVYSLAEQTKVRKAATAAEERQAVLRKQELELRERQAGEYYELTKEQMVLQAQMGQITTLANLLEETKRPAEPRIFTLPVAKTYNPVEQINRAISRLFKAS